MGDVHRPRVEFLSQGQVALVLEQAYQVLDTIGVLIENDEAVALLSGAGARSSNDGTRWLISRELCERCLKTVPSSFTLFDRNGQAAFEVGGDETHFDPGSAATLILDFHAKKMRKPTTRDVIDFVRVTDRLSAMDAQSTGLVPGDVPETIADRYRLFLALIHSAKPIITGTFTKKAHATMLAFLTAIRGSESALRKRPLALFDCCPTSPLSWSDLTAQSLIDSARAGVPANLVPAPLIGATSPVTLAGTLVQHIAENLSGIVIHQSSSPGAPLVFGGAATLFDMRRGTAPMSAAEAVMVDAGYVQVGRHLALPTHSYMGVSDAKTLDAQAGAETAFGATMATMSGVNIASGAGLLNYVLCQSLEKLVVDNELCEVAKRTARGIEFPDDDNPLRVIAENAPESSYLTSTHTRKYFRGEVHYPAPLVDRLSLGEWESDGSKQIGERAHDVVQSMVGSSEVSTLDDTVLTELVRLMTADAAAAGMDNLPAWQGV